MADSPDEFARRLERASRGAKDAVRPVVMKGAVHIKIDGRANSKASSGRHGKHAYQAIDFEMSETATAVQAEIGYNHDAPGNAGKQARLGGILEYGSPTSPAHRDIGRAREKEEPRFNAALTEAMKGLI